MSREDQHFRLRLPADLRVKVEDAAALHKRSMTAEILSRLEASFRLDKKMQKPGTAETLRDLLEQLIDVIENGENKERNITTRNPNEVKDGD